MRCNFTQKSLYILIPLSVVACSRHVDEEKRAGPAASSSSGAMEPLTYPHGHWRSQPDALRRVLVSFSDILISYHGAALNSKPWIAHDLGARDRVEALSTAEHLANLLREQPEQFAQLARKYSDDQASGARGGYRGIARASTISAPIIDALAALKYDGISHVIEDEDGFHVIKRLKVAENAAVAADELVVLHDELSAPWVRPGRTAARSRSAARDVAAHLAELARAQPEQFAAFVDTYSDGYDAIAGGDMGTWSLYDAAADPGLLAAIASVPVGETVGPIEDWSGFRIIRRKPPGGTIWLKSEEIVVTHSGSSLDFRDPVPTRSREEARAIAARLAARLKRRSTEFAALSAKYCGHFRCKHPPHAWLRGHGIPGLDDFVAALKIGEVAAIPVETPLGFHVIRRVAVSPDELPREDEPAFEIPDPGIQDANFFFAKANAGQLAAGAAAFKEVATRELALPPDKADKLRRVLDEFAESLRSLPVEQRPQIRESTRQALVSILGDDGYGKYLALRDRWLRNYQLEQ
jgi:hypothetical protein